MLLDPAGMGHACGTSRPNPTTTTNQSNTPLKLRRTDYSKKPLFNVQIHKRRKQKTCMSFQSAARPSKRPAAGSGRPLGRRTRRDKAPTNILRNMVAWQRLGRGQRKSEIMVHPGATAEQPGLERIRPGSHGLGFLLHGRVVPTTRPANNPSPPGLGTCGGATSAVGRRVAGFRGKGGGSCTRQSPAPPIGGPTDGFAALLTMIWGKRAPLPSATTRGRRGTTNLEPARAARP